MPTVPYNPVPDVAPTETGPSGMKIDVPGAAFGTTIASAIHSVGGDLSKVGDEIFTRAMALQDLNNRSEADEINANLTKTIGVKHEQYKTLLQQGATAGLIPHLDDLEATRRQAVDSASNGMVRRLVSSESRSLVARTTISAAAHAAQQNKVYVTQNAKAVRDINLEHVRTNPEDEAAFQAKLKESDQTLKTDAGIEGWSQNEYDRNAFQGRSKLWRERIGGMAKDKDPNVAYQMLQQHKNDLSNEDYKIANDAVTRGITTVGARQAADKINLGFDPRMSQREIDTLSGVQEPLVRLFKYVQQNHPELRFTVGDKGGMRTPEEQAELVRKGFSKTMHSAHLEGRGIDIVPVDENGKQNFNDKQAYARIEMAMKEASEALGIPLSGEHDQIKSWDPGHYSIPRDINSRPIPQPLEETVQSRATRARQYAAGQYKDDPNIQTLLGDETERRVRVGFGQQKQDQRDLDFRNENTVGEAILNGVQGSDKKPTTIEELQRDPVVAQALDSLRPAARKKALTWLAQNAKDDFTPNEERFREYTRLQGEAESDPATYLQRDLVGAELPRSWRQHLFKLQQEKFKSATANPAVTHALEHIKPMLQAANITPTNDKDDYNLFVGSLHDAMQKFLEDEKKPPKDADIDDIASRLLMKQHTDQYWTSSEEALYKLPVPPTDRKQIIQAYIAEKGTVPAEDVIRRIFIRGQYQRYYGESKTSKTTGAP